LKGELPTKMLLIVWLIPPFEKRDIGGMTQRRPSAQLKEGLSEEMTNREPI
jgi:hypothetical protein